MQEQYENANLFLKIVFITKSHVTTCHYSLFLYKMHGCSWPMTRGEKKKLSLEFLRPCAIHKNLLTKKKRKKKPAVSDSLCTWVTQYMLPFIMLHKHICGAAGVTHWVGEVTEDLLGLYWQILQMLAFTVGSAGWWLWWSKTMKISV